MSAVLTVAGLSVALGGRTVLRDVDLAVAGGELVGLIGPNGAGKTTLVRTILGLLVPERGSVTVAGRGVDSARGGDRSARAGRIPIGYVPQRHEFAWEFPVSVEQVVMTGLTGKLGLLRRPGADDWRAVDEALERVRIADLRTRPVGELSGGQRQRVAVARALALQPAALLLDEPFTGLDLPTQDLLSELFASLAREGRAVLMTTHDIAGALYGCDRLALLNGTVVAAGPPRELAADAQLWQRTFGVGERSPLLRLLKAAA